MKKIISILIFITSVASAQTGWFIQTPFTSKNLYSASSTAIYNLYAGSDSGIVFKSTNNGYNWTVFIQDTALRRLPIRFISGGNNDDFNAVGDSTAYISKNNSQVTSVRIVTGINQTKPNLRAYSFLLGLFGYQANIATGDSGIFYINDFNLWRRDTAATRIAAGTKINSSSSFIFAGDNGLIMKADSIGRIRPNGESIKWRIIPSGTTQNLYSVNVTSSGTCLVVGAGGIILKSTNFGETWASVPSPTTQDLYGLTIGYVAFLICGANGTILRCPVNTYDNWFMQTTPTTQDLHTILAITYTDYISMGNNGIILRTTDGGGPLGIISVNKEIPNSFQLNPNYPNPFNPSTVIGYQLRVSSYVKISVYDITGKHIMDLVNQKQNAGTYKVDFDGSGFSSGVYFYRIEAEDYSDIKKMVLVK